MNSGKPIQIIGGGLSGLTLGIGLRLRGVPVTIWEVGRYPRHRVCGEVLSGRGGKILDDLGFVTALEKAGARPARTSSFFAGRRCTPAFALPEPARCLSRYALDALLADRFRELQGDLREGQRWRESASEPGVVRASGRPVQATESGWRWFGLKAHFRHVDLAADVEMHLLPWGYVGLCRLSDDWTNVCGLFRRRAEIPNSSQSWQEWLSGPVDSMLHERLANARCNEESFCAVAGLPLRPRQASNSTDCLLGDALTMISPVTGNGMSMALEAADLATSPLTAYSQGESDWDATRSNIARACDARFATRLRWASYLHAALFRSIGRRVLLLAGTRPLCWRTVFRLTR